MMTSKEITKFLFHQMDNERNNFLRKEQFEKLMDYLAETSFTSSFIWKKSSLVYYRKLIYFIIYYIY